VEKYGQFLPLPIFNPLTLFLSSVTQKWADQAAYSLACLLCLLKMMIMIARPRPLSGILYPCPRRSDAIGNLMSILGERQLLECSLAVLQQSPDLSNTLLPAKHIAGQLRDDKQTSLRIQN